MPYNPNVPQPNDPLDANVVRQQMNELNAKIDAQAAVIAALQAQLATCITQAQLDAAIATRASLPAAVDPLGYGASDPPTQGEVQGGFDLLATLIVALKQP